MVGERKPNVPPTASASYPGNAAPSAVPVPAKPSLSRSVIVKVGEDRFWVQGSAAGDTHVPSG